ncbi:hypothetical protein SY83_16885 [Paenibacillus swuensis]|uniref:ABC transporter permease n=1 Tax=Paenibacillus swuensis TaxID=1178515 RepID=A0A172TKX2_9BACL|nr:ABC transporter permease subunit [Paenibacillus swuensis]ANE47680.1 hypothetical protein SY83_16885 [Paenibacillus swuensis]
MMTILMMTWKEMMRKRVLSLTFILTVVFLIGFWYVAKIIGNDGNMGVPDPTQNLIRDFSNGSIILSLGFFFATFVIAFLSIFSSFSVVSGEAEQGVMQALLPRPLPRWKWFMGRWLGYTLLGVLYSALLFIALLFITDLYAGIPRELGVWMKSFLLFAWIVPLLVSVSMLGSCYFPAFGNGVFMIMMYGAGWLGGMLEKVTATGMFKEDSRASLDMVSGLTSLAMPVDTLQRRMLAELFSFKDMQSYLDIDRMGPFSLQAIPSNTFLVYAALYTVAALLLGMFTFQRKDL